MAYVKKKAIDGQKLRTEILNRFKTYVQADKSLGFCNAVGNWVNKNEIPEYNLMLIEAKWGVTYDMIKPDEPKPEPKEEVKESEETDKEDLNALTYKMMQSAAYVGVAEFCNKHLGSIIQSAIVRALKEVKNKKGE